MHIYSYVDYADNHAGALYFGTLAEAHAEGKKLEEVWRSNVRIRLLDVDTSKAGVIAILNHKAPHDNDGIRLNDMTLRSWTLTPRGGIKELTE